MISVSPCAFLRMSETCNSPMHSSETPGKLRSISGMKRAELVRPQGAPDQAGRKPQRRSGTRRRWSTRWRWQGPATAFADTQNQATLLQPAEDVLRLSYRQAALPGDVL